MANAIFFGNRQTCFDKWRVGCHSSSAYAVLKILFFQRKHLFETKKPKDQGLQCIFIIFSVYLQGLPQNLPRFKSFKGKYVVYFLALLRMKFFNVNNIGLSKFILFSKWLQFSVICIIVIVFVNMKRILYSMYLNECILFVNLTSNANL